MRTDRASEDSMTADQHVQYQERLWPSPGMWALVPVAGLSGALTVGPYGTAVWLSVGLVFLVLAAAALITFSPTIRITDGELSAGRARIPVRFLGEVGWAEGEQARQERGPRLDARAWLLIRGWVGPVVKVAIDDPQDPTPYWLLSTRRPRELAAAIDAARPG